MPLFGKAKKEEPGPEPFTPPATPPAGEPPAGEAYPTEPLGMQEQGYPPQQIYEQQQGVQFQGAAPMPPPLQAQPGVDRERIEEVAEAIIDEKWNELLKDVNKMIEWKEKTEARLMKFEEELKNLKTNFESLHKGILGKISEYDQNLVSVGTEIKAMEKVFQKVLPTFTENVNKLDRLTRGAPAPKPILKKK